MGLLQNWLILSLVLLLSLSLSPHSTMGTDPLYTTVDQFQFPVVDSRLNPLEPGAEYYIRVNIPQRIIVGITRAPRSIGRICPLYAVSQKLVDLRHAQPVRFIPIDPSQTQIRETVDQVKIDSGFSAMCRDNGIWRMMPNATTGQLEVVASGAFNVPESSFRFIRVRRTSNPIYAISYCPQGQCRPLVTSSSDNNFAGVLGVPLDNQGRVEPLQVFFVKKTAQSLADDM